MTLFLSPADPTNARKSLAQPVKLAAIRAAISDDGQFDQLIALIGERLSVFCWAVRASKQSVFKMMQPGDEVLFSVTGSGNFDFWGEISATLISETFAVAIWDDESLRGWPHIFFLKDVRQVQVAKPLVRQVLGYNSADRFQGLRPIPARRTRDALSFLDLFPNMLSR